MIPAFVAAQDVEVRGIVQDAQGAGLYLANIVVLPDSIATSCDVEGRFSLYVSKGLKTILVSYTGFEPITVREHVGHARTFSFEMVPRVDELQAVVIENDRYSNEDILHSTVTSTQTLTRNDLIHLPSFMGESDLLKAVRLLPGSAQGMEGSADLFVRGGAADQNLVLLDDAPVYNAGHLLGFLSVFNPDILDKVDVIHGGFPAEYGGRLSSVLNVTTISRLADRTTVSADAGLTSSRVKIEQPVAKDKAGFWLAGRGSYVDKVVQYMTGKDVPYQFYELNGKFIFHPSASDKIELSHYTSGDDLDFLRDDDQDGKGMHTTHRATNMSQTFKWRHMNPGSWQSDLSMFHTSYGYHTMNAYKREYQVSATSDIEDFGARLSLRKDSLWGRATFGTGMEWIRHQISPKVLNSEGSISDVVESGSSHGKRVNEFAVYVQQEWPVSEKLVVNAGVRGSLAVAPSRKYVFPEPRISLRYAIGDDRALKFNYSRMVQYLHRISNSSVSTPIDVWFPVTDSIRPQTSHQFAAAWQRFISVEKIFLSAEAYYKSMKDLVAYEEGTNFLFKSDFESRLLQGEGKAYGLEFLVRKESGKLTGWISYSLSWSWRRYDGLNGGQWFRARYDRRHNGAVVAQWVLGKRWMVSAVWEYISGARFTPVVGQYVALAPNGTGLDLIPEFAAINSVKLSDSHRLDLGLKYFSKPESKWQWALAAGVYNVYNRATPFGIVIKQDEHDNALRYMQPGLFGLLPYVSYGCKF